MFAPEVSMSPTLEADTGPRWDRTVLVWAELGSEMLCYVLCECYVLPRSDLPGLFEHYRMPREQLGV